MLQRVAITGAAGFLGAHFVDGFATHGAGVLPLARTLDSRTEKWPSATTVSAAVHDPGRLRGCGAIIHSAAVRHRHGVENAEYQASNVDVVATLMGAAAAAEVRRFVFVSSVGVYGYPGRLPITEEYPYAPPTHYAVTKMHAERLARARAAELGIELCIVRPTIVYGPADTNGMLDKMVRMIRAGTYRVVGDGNNTLHHTHVDDIVRGVVLAASHPAGAGEDFILAGPETITLERFSRLVAETLGNRLPRLHVPLRPARAIATVLDVAGARTRTLSRCEPPISHEKLDVMTRSVAFDSSKATRLLGYAPSVGYVDGLRRTLLPREGNTTRR